MKHNVPIPSQVLHFLDFNLTGKHIGYWREKSMRERYRAPNGPYDAPMFLDSGGFKLDELIEVLSSVSGEATRGDSN